MRRALPAGTCLQKLHLPKVVGGTLRALHLRLARWVPLLMIKFANAISSPKRDSQSERYYIIVCCVCSLARLGGKLCSNKRRGLFRSSWLGFGLGLGLGLGRRATAGCATLNNSSQRAAHLRLRSFNLHESSAAHLGQPSDFIRTTNEQQQHNLDSYNGGQLVRALSNLGPKNHRLPR